MITTNPVHHSPPHTHTLRLWLSWTCFYWRTYRATVDCSQEDLGLCSHLNMPPRWISWFSAWLGFLSLLCLQADPWVIRFSPANRGQLHMDQIGVSGSNQSVTQHFSNACVPSCMVRKVKSRDIRKTSITQGNPNITGKMRFHTEHANKHRWWLNDADPTHNAGGFWGKEVSREPGFVFCRLWG